MSVQALNQRRTDVVGEADEAALKHQVHTHSFENSVSNDVCTVIVFRLDLAARLLQCTLRCGSNFAECTLIHS